MYSLENLAKIKWKINNIRTYENLVLENIKYYEYKDGLVSFKTKTHNKNIKIEEIISEDDE